MVNFGELMSTFVTLDDLKPFMSRSIYNILNQDVSTGLKYFTAIEPEVVNIIETVGTYIDLSVSVPDWIKYPAAAVFSKVAKRLLTELDPVFSQTLEQDYQAALEMIRIRSMQESISGEPSDNSSSFNGTIGDTYEW